MNTDEKEQCYHAREHQRSIAYDKKAYPVTTVLEDIATGQSDTQRTDSYHHAFMDIPSEWVGKDFARQLEKAFNAACAFIDLSVCDPDTTPAMTKAFKTFSELR